MVFGAPAWLAVSAGFLVGYVVYDTMHWYLHHRIPRSRIGRRLRELHLRHHFQDDTRGFGISAPYWDRVFHTAPVSRREATGRREGRAADGLRRPSAPHLRGRLDDEAQLGAPLLVVREAVALDRRREAALARQAQLVERDSNVAASSMRRFRASLVLEPRPACW